MQVAVFHPGTQHSWQTALALQQLDKLAWYATSIFYKPDEWPYRIERYLPSRLRRAAKAEFARFAMPALDPALVKTSGAAEWLERIAARLGRRQLARWLDKSGNLNFVHHIEKLVSGTEPLGLWGYNSSSLKTFELAKRYGHPCILDRTIGDQRVYNELMDQLQEQYSAWFLPTIRRVPEDRIQIAQREYELADHIVVGSEFAAQTVRDRGGAAIASKVTVLPYCFDETLFGNLPQPEPILPGEQIRFLFVGQINPRKGIHHLLEAFAQIPPGEASLTIVGSMDIPHETFARYAERVEYLPTVPRTQIPAIMARHHVLVFPSYFEGSALSLLEALAAGLAIVQTPASGNGVTDCSGIMIEHLSTETLLAAMRDAMSDRERLDAWRRAAQAEATKFTFARYRENIARLLARWDI